VSAPRVAWLTGLCLFVLACDPGSQPPRRPPSDERRPCEDFELDVERIWSKQTRAQVKAGIVQLDASSGKTIAERVVTRMDAVTRDWVMMQQRCCIDTVVHKTMPAEVYTKITACLLTNLAQQRQIVLIASAPNLAQIELLERSIIDAGNDAAICLDKAIYSYYDGDEQAELAREAIAEAQVLREFGDVAQADKLLDAASESVEASKSDAVKVDLRVEDAWIAFNKADYEAATRASDEALALASASHYEIGRANASLLRAIIARTRGDYELSGKLLQQALEIQQRLFGPEDYRSALTLASLGVLQEELGHYPQALDYYQRSHAVLERELGPESLEVATSYQRLADLRLALADQPGAVELYGKARAIVEKVLGPESAELVPIDSDLALVLAREGKDEAALELASKALATSERVHGVKHPRTAEAHMALAEVFVTGGRLAEALEHAKSALAIYSALFGQVHVTVASVWHLLGFIYDAQGQHRQALESYEQAVELSDDIYGPQHPDTALTLRELGRQYVFEKDLARALELYLRALAIQTQTSAPAVELAITHESIARIYEAQQDDAKALEHFGKAVAEYEQAGNEESAGVLYTSIGTHHYEAGQLDATLDAYAKAEELLTQARGPADADVKETHHWISRLCKQRPRHRVCAK
jgi:tetratricopeptide (TPR) repeat protein